MRIERTALQMHARKVDAGFEDIGVARQRLRREQAGQEDLAVDLDSAGGMGDHNLRFDVRVHGKAFGKPGSVVTRIE